MGTKIDSISQKNEIESEKGGSNFEDEKKAGTPEKNEKPIANDPKGNERQTGFGEKILSKVRDFLTFISGVASGFFGIDHPISRVIKWISVKWFRLSPLQKWMIVFGVLFVLAAIRFSPFYETILHHKSADRVIQLFLSSIGMNFAVSGKDSVTQLLPNP
ncbi:hypothetical protein MKX03_018822, partial [Papaver bracteatum]